MASSVAPLCWCRKILRKPFLAAANAGIAKLFDRYVDLRESRTPQRGPRVRCFRRPPTYTTATRAHNVAG